MSRKQILGAFIARQRCFGIGLTQQAIANRVGRSRQWVAKLEKGTARMPSVDMLAKLGDALRVNLVDLVLPDTAARALDVDVKSFSTVPSSLQVDALEELARLVDQSEGAVELVVPTELALILLSRYRAAETLRSRRVCDEIASAIDEKLPSYFEQLDEHIGEGK